MLSNKHDVCLSDYAAGMPRRNDGAFLKHAGNTKTWGALSFGSFSLGKQRKGDLQQAKQGSTKNENYHTVITVHLKNENSNFTQVKFRTDLLSNNLYLHRFIPKFFKPMPYAKFDYFLDYKNLNLREHPELYRTGVGEQGVLLVEPYKSEILPFWRFKTPEMAKVSSEKIYQLFLSYKKQKDFVGMDMARKFLQMGYTRSRRYANHKSGKKYDGPVPDDKKGQSGAHGRAQLPKMLDDVKAESASIFYVAWQKAKNNKIYQKLLEEHKDFYRI